METNIRFIPFTSPIDKGWDEAWVIYENSFPYKECRSLNLHIEALKEPRFKALGIWQDNNLAGILYNWQLDNDLYYVEHLAISPKLRGLDMGSQALKAFCAEHGRVVLEIDPPIDDISIRRLNFYQRIGFAENPHEYLHPSFRDPFTTHKLVLMSWPTLLSNAEATRFADFVRGVVLRYSEHENPSLPRL